jgi:hypothetical protein
MSWVFYDADLHGAGTAAGTRWRFAADTVMGGVSRGGLELGAQGGRTALLLRGEVSLENGGGFIQMNADLGAGPVDLSDLTELELVLSGDGGPFVVLLKTTDLARPWQSYRYELEAPAAWATHRVRLEDLHPHRTDAPLDLRRARRLGLAALGRPGPARLALATATLR